MDTNRNVIIGIVVVILLALGLYFLPITQQSAPVDPATAPATNNP